MKTSGMAASAHPRQSCHVVRRWISYHCLTEEKSCDSGWTEIIIIIVKRLYLRGA